MASLPPEYGHFPDHFSRWAHPISARYNYGDLRTVKSSEYSCLPPWCYESFVSIFRGEGLAHSRFVLWDMTANVGVETIALCHAFGWCGLACELDSFTLGALRYNVQVAGLGDRVQVIEEDSVRLLETALPQGPGEKIVYFDPPWGGRSYKEMEDVELELSGENITGLVQRALRVESVHVVVVKAPLNLNPAVFSAWVGEGLDVHLETVVSNASSQRPDRPVFDLYFIRRQSPTIPVEMPPRVITELLKFSMAHFRSNFVAAREAVKETFTQFFTSNTEEGRAKNLELLSHCLRPTDAEQLEAQSAAERRNGKQVESILRALKWVVPPGTSYVDIGGGDETITRAVKRALPAIERAVCVEPAPASATSSEKMEEEDVVLQQVRVEEMSADSQINQHGYGLLTALMSLHHVGDQALGIRKMTEVAHPGAQLIIRDYDIGARGQWTRTEAAQYLDSVHRIFQVMEGASAPDQVGTHYRSSKEWELLFRASGWKELKHFPAAETGRLWNYTASFIKGLPSEDAERVPPWRKVTGCDNGRGRGSGRGRGRSRGRGHGRGRGHSRERHKPAD